MFLTDLFVVTIQLSSNGIDIDTTVTER